MHPYTNYQLAAILKAELQPPHAAVLSCSGIVHDSRRIPLGISPLFVALHGPRFNGHQFLKAAYEAGVRVFLVDQTPDLGPFPEASFLVVDHTNEALQLLAAHHRQQFSIPVIGITGSNGKTIVKEWLFQLLHDSYRIVRSPASYNSQVGVPLSVLRLQAADELAIFEAGISQQGEMEKLVPIIDCTIGLFTNIGTAHAAGFSSLAEKVEEKARLFATAQTIIYCKDHPLVDQALSALGPKTFAWSMQARADLSIQQVESKAGETEIIGIYQAETIKICIPFIDKASIENAIHCWALLLHLGLDPELIAARMQQLHSLGLRLALKAGINQCTLIDDSYNADITSLANALDFLGQQPPERKRSLILSDLLQSGMSPENLYAQMATLIQQSNVQQLIGIGTAIPILADYLPPEIKQQYFQTTNEFLRQDIASYFQQETVLLKGARSFAFDQISTRLSAQQHRTVLEVNLPALSHNLRVFQESLAASTKVMVMVKAAAYGSGSLEVARRLAYLGVDYLAVAYVDEGIRLRQGGVRLPILVLNPEEMAFEAMLRYELEPEIYALDQLKALEMLALEEQQALKIHLKLDTGMNRLGFGEGQLQELSDYLAARPEIQVVSVFTHLAASEDPGEDQFSEYQIERFQKAYEQLVAKWNYRPLRHVLNSSGIARFPQYQFDMVRLGIGLYGILEEGKLADSLQAVLMLKARVSQLRWLAAGETIGYGRAGIAQEAMHLAIVSVGYADGLPREVGKNGYALSIHGHPAPIIGNVCMDMCMVDVTSIPAVREKDEVVVFGRQPTVQDLAQAASRIPYEILTGISARVQRLYIT